MYNMMRTEDTEHTKVQDTFDTACLEQVEVVDKLEVEQEVDRRREQQPEQLQEEER